MAKETIPFLGKTGVGILWKRMKDYYADALRGDGSQLETEAKTVVEAINELYSKVDSIVNAPKIDTLEIIGESTISSAGNHSFKASFSPEAETFLVWGIKGVGGESITPASISIDPTTGDLEVVAGTNGQVEIFVTDAFSKISAELALTINTTIKAESISIVGESKLGVLGQGYEYSITTVPENASTDLTWNLSKAPEGWSIDSRTGNLFLNYNAEFYQKEVTIELTDGISEKTVTKAVTPASSVSVIFPETITTVEDGWYNNGNKNASKNLVSAITLSRTITELGENSLKDFSKVDLDIPETVTTLGDGSLTGLNSVTAYPENWLRVKELFSGASLIGGITDFEITELAEEYTETGSFTLNISKTPAEGAALIEWSLKETLSGVSINSETGELTIEESHYKKPLTIVAKDLYLDITKEASTVINTAKTIKSFSLTNNEGTVEITGITPENAYYVFKWSCNKEGVTISESGLSATLTTAPGFYDTVTITVTDTISEVTKDIEVEIDTRVPLKNLNIIGPTKITAPGNNYKYTVTYDDPIPESYKDLIISCSGEGSDGIDISTEGVLTVPKGIKKSITIKVEDTYSGLSKEITVSIDTTSTLILTYDFEDSLPGNANGEIKLSTTSEGDYGNYEVFYGDESGVPLTDYQAINYVDTTTNTSDNDNIPITLNASQKEASFKKFIGANVLPREAKTVVACKEKTDKVLAVFEIPVTKRTSSLDLGEKKYSIGMISDIHIDDTTDKNDNDGNADLNRTIQLFKDYGVAAICSAGDVTDDGENNQWQAVKTLITEHGLKTAAQTDGTLPFYIATGNHDARKIETFTPNTGYDTYNKQTIGDDVYIFCGLNNACNDILGNNFTKLQTDLEANKDRSRVFVFQHVPIPKTNGNAERIYAYNAWTNNSDNPYATNTHSVAFENLMKKYDNVILVNGHSHLKMWNQVFDPNANYFRYSEGGARMFHLPSLTYPREWKWETGGYTDATNDQRRFNDVDSSEACIMDVYEKGIIFRSLNCKQEKFIGIAEYLAETKTNSVVPDEPDTENATLIFHLDKDLNSTGGTGEGWFIDKDGKKVEDTVVTTSKGNIVNKFTDASLISDTASTGTMRTIPEWTLLAHVKTTDATASNTTTGYHRAICDSPVNFNGGFNIDYWPSSGWVVNVMHACVIGSTTGENVFTTINDDVAANATNSVDEVKVVVKRSKGDVFTYSTDGRTWGTATNYIQNNANNKSFTIGGTGGSGSQPFYGHVKCDIYDSSEIDSTIINEFFDLETIVATSITVSGPESITAAGTQIYAVTTSPEGATTRLKWTVTGDNSCKISSGGVLTIPAKKEGLSATLTITATDSISGKSGSLTVTVNIPPKEDSGEGDTPEISSEGLVFYVDRNYTANGVTAGYTEGQGWYKTSAGTEMNTLTQTQYSSNSNWSDKFDTSLIANQTGSYRYLNEWTLLAFVEHTSETSTLAAGKYARALCDTPDTYPGGINIDYWPGSGWIVNVMRSCAIGTATEFTGSNEASASQAAPVEGNKVKIIIRRQDTTVQYSTDFGVTWTTATNNFQDNKGKVLTLGGTNSVNNPYYGHVKCAVYENYQVDSATISGFFNETIPTLETLSIVGKKDITSAGTYTYTATKTPIGAIANLSWEVSGITGVTINSTTGVLTVPANVKGTLNLTVKDISSSVTNVLSITVDTTVTTPEPEPDPETPDTPGGGGGSGLIWQVSSGDASVTSNYAIASATSSPTNWTLCVNMSITGNAGDCGLKCSEDFSVLTLAWGQCFLFAKIFGKDIYGYNWQCADINITSVKFVVTREGNTVKYRKSNETSWTTISNPSFGNGNLEFVKGNITFSKVDIRLYDSILGDSDLSDFFILN